MRSRNKKKTKSLLKHFVNKNTVNIVDLLVLTILIVIVVLIVKYNNIFGSNDGFYSRKIKHNRNKKKQETSQ